jgi:hypothetical protein
MARGGIIGTVTTLSGGDGDGEFLRQDARETRRADGVRRAGADWLGMPQRTHEPRCTESRLRTLGLLVTSPLAFAAILCLAIGIASAVRSPVLPLIVSTACVLTLWTWTFSRHGPVEAWRLGRLRRRIALHQAMPWLGDHAWDTTGTKGQEPRAMRNSGCAWIVGLWAMSFAAVMGHGAPWVVLGVVLTWRAWAMWRSSGRGRGQVSFVRFPYFPGEPLELHFGMNSGGATFLHARYALRRIREVDAWWYDGGPRREVTFAAECCPAEGVLPGPESDVRLLFDVPANAGGTSLASRMPSYWELAVVGETTKGAFDETFLVPIYERPAS